MLIPPRYIPSLMKLTLDAAATDPPLLDRHSTINSYSTSGTTYPKLRVFYRKHQQADNLPIDPAPIPLLVFIHGLGGSIAQFHSLLSSLTQIATCLAVDLPGCGRSELKPESWDAYSTDKLAELLETIIEDHRELNQGVVLIAHSMGGSLAALLANPRKTPKTPLHKHVLGLVGICPTSAPPTEKQVRLFRIGLCIPEFIFNIWRAYDRRGGAESASVARFVGPNADAEAKRLQNIYNWQSKTPTWRRMAWGALPVYTNGVPQGGIPTPDVWAGLNIPVFLIGGEADHVTPPSQVRGIVGLLEGKSVDEIEANEAQAIVDAAAPVDTGPVDPGTYDSRDDEAQDSVGSDGTSSSDSGRRRHVILRSIPPPEPPAQPVAIPPLPSHPKKVVKSVIIPGAGHGVLYTAPIVPGLVSDFIAEHVTGRLSLSWQLQYLCRDGKWDVKNLEKWKKVEPVSDPIVGIFRAIKTLREVDEKHCPRLFVHEWGEVIKDVIDISHDNPVYDPEGLVRGGIMYHKFPTLSKVPPGDTEIEGFIQLVEKIQNSQKERALKENWIGPGFIGVHCHYGFNRTGFLICCYLIEKENYPVQEAIDVFAKARPNGIKHKHFKDRLFVRKQTSKRASEQTPLLAETTTRRNSEDSHRLAEEEDAALHGTSLSSSSPSSSRRKSVREILLFTWALLATAGVIVLAVVLQHRNATTTPAPVPGDPMTGDPFVASSLPKKLKNKKKNLIFMVSDGMGPASLSLTRSFRQHVSGLPIDDTLTLDRHFWGTSRTRSSNSLVTDSAAGATAFSCARKSYNGAIGMEPGYKPCGTVLEAAKRAGYHTGLVVTTDITDATPACFAAHVAYRLQMDEIALQEIGEGVLGRSVDLMLGGGRCHFLPNSTSGSCRQDDTNVVDIAQKKHGWGYVDNRAGFDSLRYGKNVTLPLLGLFAAGDIPFEIDRRNMADIYPSLSEMAVTALKALEEATKDSEKGFFLMIEGSRIDHAGHINDPAAQVREVLEYDKAFKAVLDFIEQSDTEGVLVATSDHETGGLSTAWQAPLELPVYNWYPQVLAKANASAEYLARLLAEHIIATPAESKESLMTWVNEELVAKLGISDALEVELSALASNPLAAVTLFSKMISMRARVGWSTHGHSAVDVNIYSSGGPGTEKIRGNVENIEVGGFLRGYLDVDVESITKELREKMESVEVKEVEEGKGEEKEEMHGHPESWVKEV
ncbi:alkaline phosphatase [Podospora australis]|uniref:Alkaline phosphatase n=1 Tax=Podospora australis TaxID=1536484 RepID=A0AAN6X4M9_9PEZI|nr:alkaline phosphatase [Podospora australis]